MSEQNLTYFKFVTALIDNGLWAAMSPAARTLYPVLLRFSDRNFKPVYPGSRVLLELTGFKQKSSLRKARRELVDLGLITVTEGTGRKNTLYHFNFDTVVQPHTPGEQARTPLGVTQTAPTGSTQAHPEGSFEDRRYNQIHISINNNVQNEAGEHSETPPDANEKRKLDFLIRRFGERNLGLARSECELAGIPATASNLEKILYREEQVDRVSWSEIEKYLTDKISPGSLAQMHDSLIEERDGWIIFEDRLPEHMKMLLRRLTDRVFFEPDGHKEKMPGNSVEKTRQFWNSSGAMI